MLDRYNTVEMKEIWSEESKFQSWLDVEIMAVEAFAKIEGTIKIDVLESIKKNASFSLERISEIEIETKHDVIAFTRCVSESLSENERKWIHFGLTSTDVVDTALALRFKKANKIIKSDLNTLNETLKEMAIKYKSTYQIGRTHGIHAEITTFGYKIANWFEEINRNIERFEFASKGVEIGKISGAVGNYSNIKPEIQDYICQNLDINSSKISSQTLQRDRHADYIFTISLIGSTLDKIATELRHLQRTEVGEVEESFSKSQKGSSAMPHKKNPISAENISGLSRLLRGFVVTSMENIALWHERDISHSSNERIIFADATTLISYMIRRLNRLLKNLKINSDKMIENIELTHGSIFSQRIILFLIETKSFTREKAYDIIQPIAIDCYTNRKNFKNELINKKILSDIEVVKLFDLSYYSKNIDCIFDRLKIK